jgi:hypothetical protein
MHDLYACALQDVNKEPGAEDMFKKISEAYEVGGHSAELRGAVCSAGVTGWLAGHWCSCPDAVIIRYMRLSASCPAHVPYRVHQRQSRC